MQKYNFWKNSTIVFPYFIYRLVDFLFIVYVLVFNQLFQPVTTYTSLNLKIEIEMKKIGDKSSILSPITGFQTQKPFRKPSDSNPQEPAIISNNSWTKASLRWRESIKAGSIGLNKSCFKIMRRKIFIYAPLQLAYFGQNSAS